MPKISGSPPTVFHLGRMWPTIGKFQYRVLLAWIEIRAYRNFMRAFARCYSRQTSPVELYAIRLGRNRTVFSGGKVKQTLIFIEALEGTSFPLAIGNLPQQFAIRAIVIKMVPTITLALP